jgi:deazaflavin-dependent oxidoreductase (nitroreductase family)|tara:strand:- start:71 stop:520 length:450 start_codon:yes stop_codon:yes gene_type:complete
VEKKNKISSMRRKIIFFVLFLHNYIYIYSNGRFGKTISDRPCLILESIGGKTGKLRKNVLVYLKEENFICIVASKGGNPKNPGWYHNLKNNPEAKIQIGRERFNVVAREIFDLERTEWWKKMDFMNNGVYEQYQNRTSRKIPIMLLEIT